VTGVRFFIGREMKKKKEKSNILVENRKARHDYAVLEAMEAGLVLTGTEIKALRNGNGNLTDSFARIDDGEVWVHHFYIGHYKQGNIYNVDTLRPRKLLLHAEEIRRLIGKTQEKGLTLVPMKVYLKEGKAKVDLALARGKHQYDKRDTIAEREADRTKERVMKKILED
jgi:SsrA-binding protein